MIHVYLLDEEKGFNIKKFYSFQEKEARTLIYIVSNNNQHEAMLLQDATNCTEFKFPNFNFLN